MYAVLLLLVVLAAAERVTGSTNETRPWALRTAVREDLLWRQSTQHIAQAVTVGGESVGRLLGPLLDYPLLLPRAQLQAGVAYGGPRLRLRRFVRNLLSGRRQLKIGVVGGSVTWGEGCSQRGVTDWFSVLARWMIDAFPAANITARNGAVPATPSSYMIMCLELSVDVDVDLVIVEYGINDGYEDHYLYNSVVRTSERLLRRLLALPGRPAVVVLQVPMYGIAMDVGHPEHRDFYFSSEDVAGVLSQYYDVPYLSLRTALYRLAAFDKQDGWRWNQTFTNFHPGDAGFKAMADLVVWLLQATALDMLLADPWGPADADALGRPLPPPMVPGNTPPDATMCVVGEGFHRLVSSSEGFVWTDEGSGLKRKFGFVANWSDPVAQPRPPRLAVLLDSRRAPELVGAGQAVPVYMHYLASHMHMGRAEFSCTSGCSCAPLVVDANSTQRASQTYLARLNVTQSALCEVTVRVLEGTSSGERKFKVSGVVVSETGGEATVLERMTDARGYFAVGRFHTGEMQLAEYGAKAGGAGLLGTVAVAGLAGAGAEAGATGAAAAQG